jgi:hypothetical protein
MPKENFIFFLVLAIVFLIIPPFNLHNLEDNLELCVQNINLIVLFTLSTAKVHLFLIHATQKALIFKLLTPQSISPKALIFSILTISQNLIFKHRLLSKCKLLFHAFFEKNFS